MLILKDRSEVDKRHEMPSIAFGHYVLFAFLGSPFYVVYNATKMATDIGTAYREITDGPLWMS